MTHLKLVKSSNTPHDKYVENGTLPKRDEMWGGFNWGILQFTAGSKGDLIKRMEKETGKPWEELRRYMELHPISMIPKHLAKDKPVVGGLINCDGENI